MTFENPSAAWWALVAVPVLILYLVRLNVHRETVGTGMFWRLVLPKTSPLLRRIASLFAQLVLITLLIAGLARLYLAPDFGSRRIAVYIDNSPSMAAAHNGQTRLTESIEHARDLIRQLRIGDQMAIYATSPIPHAVCRMTSFRKQLDDSLSQIEVTSTLTAVQSRPMPPDDVTRVFLLSDRHDTSVDSQSTVRTVQIQVGTSADNAAVTRVAARRNLFDSGTAEVMIELASFADKEINAPLIIELDGAELSRESVTLAAEGVWRKAFRIAGVSSGRITVRLDHEDANSQDNVVSLELPPLESTTVRLMGDAPAALADALRVVPNARIAEQESEQADINLYYGASNADDTKPALVINPTDSSTEWTVGEFQYDLAVTQDNDSPLVSGVALDNAVYERVRAITPLADVQVAAAGTSAAGTEFPLLFTIDGTRRQVVLAADLEQTDLVHRRDLARLLANAFAWLKPLGPGDRVATTTHADNDLRVVRVPAAALTNPFDYPWWYWPCWYLSLATALALLPLEWWLYQRRIIA